MMRAMKTIMTPLASARALVRSTVARFARHQLRLAMAGLFVLNGSPLQAQVYVPFNTTYSQEDTRGGGLEITPAVGNDDFHPASYTELLFADEFNGDALDRSKWCTRFSWGGGTTAPQVEDPECTPFVGQGNLDFVNDEWQRYRDVNIDGEPLHVLSNGVIALRATKNNSNPGDLSFEGAMLRSKLNIRPEGSQRYYITARVRLPSARGTWPMIWLAPDLDENGVANWPPEIDILEAPVNDETETIYTLYQHSQIHQNQTGSNQHEYTYSHPDYDTRWGFWKGSQSLREIWLEIGTEWSADEVCYFINGIKLACENYRWVTNAGRPANKSNLLINMAVGGAWPGRNGVDVSKFPVQMELDHIRIYTR